MKTFLQWLLPLFLFALPSGAVDTSTLDGKLMCGYQGWFNAEGDGAQRGWAHWTKAKGTPSAANIKIDLWPDVSELAPDERFATALRFPDGRVAELFSSYKRDTVLRHFRWMRDYGIDGAFIQRFIGSLRDPRFRQHNDTVLAHCRDGAKISGRGYAVMYDLSGLGAGRIGEVIDDWHRLRDEMKITGDAAYQRHRGKPLVAVWGVGFNDRRAYTLAECRQLVEALKRDGCTVMLGVPAHWRTLAHDAVNDPALHEILALADIVSPWTVGRYHDEAAARRYAERTVAADIAWCREHRLDYLPVAFPGFSWHNMKGDTLDAIPRKHGAFFWSQVVADKNAGATMLYVAMFDEVDEGTAIFKCVAQPPTSNGARFVGFDGGPDFYLRLAGLAGKVLRGELPPTNSVPLVAEKKP
jgi:hypothetical protein